MSLADPAIYLLLCGALVLLGAASLRRWCRIVFTAVNLLFVAAILQGSASSAALLAAFLVAHYGTLRAMRRWPKARTALYWGWLAGALLAFVVVKRYDWLTQSLSLAASLPDDLVTIGLSFVFFRQLCLAIEVRDGALDAPGPGAYVNYHLAYWTFVAGPLQRYEDFDAQYARFDAAGPVAEGEVLSGLNRAALGLIKVFVLARAAEGYANVETFAGRPGFASLVLLLLAFPVYLYLNFSGYCDLMIGLARAVGFVLPENFNHPYLARNIGDFWTRWHITLSELWRDYVYFPMQTVLARRAPIVLAMSVATLASFVLMGAWHGSTLGFVVFGLMHGAALVVVNLYGLGMKALLGKEGWRRYQRSVVVRGAAIVLCQAYVLLAFLPFRYGAEDLRVLAHGLGMAGPR